MNTAQVLVKCLESEGVQYIFGIPGEENLEIIEALRDSPIQFITVASASPRSAPALRTS